MSIKIGNYLFTRLRQLGINTVFGVPGGKVMQDFSFVAFQTS